MHVIMFSLVIVAAIVVTALLFVGWLIVMVLRGLTRLFLGPGLMPTTRPAPRRMSHTRSCNRQSCKSINPVEARFCRRCGGSLDGRNHLPAGHAVMV